MKVEAIRTLRVARVVLEALTPLSLTTGNGSGSFDTSLVVDANGLPTIPGPSLKGALRGIYRALFMEEPEEQRTERYVFGFMEGENGAPAKLQTSWGWCHDQNDNPVVGRLQPTGDYPQRFSGPNLDDKLLAFFLSLSETPVVRERVRLNGRGVADGLAKFDRSIVPAGARFTVELTYVGSEVTEPHDEVVWDRLLSILLTPGLRLGGATRSGLGLMAPVKREDGRLEAGERRFRLDSSCLKPLKEFRDQTAACGSLVGFEPIERSLERSPGLVSCVRRMVIELNAKSSWRFGGGDISLSGSEVDAAPKAEVCIIWTRGAKGSSAELTAADQTPILIPGSSVKGALRHRTLFHFRRRLLDQVSPQSFNQFMIEDNMAVLFGREKKTRAGKEIGRAGLVIVDDVFKSREDKDYCVQNIKHVSIDRFSGGARQGLLFDEEVIVGGRLSFTIWLAPSFDGLPEPLRRAFDDALLDLKRGWLPLGAAAARGHGRFEEVKTS